MKFLLDTNVLSESVRPQPDARVLDFIAREEWETCTSSVVIGELESGVLMLAQGRKRLIYQAWMEKLLETTEVLPFDLAAAREWARMMVRLQEQGRPLPLPDSMIAATALVHGLTVVTRNVRDFERSGVAVLNPFEGTGPAE